ncbi:hypothetical protein NLU13_9660 [Sarocladium strictum]|uniref:Uncharacterized protein n=1 Tax=Sarocladium strictum TaxID=5046 RepID=A0AA39L4M4_SARSR|nr:hypothetical protein NLU13_9660 [Sarocladium strictum]
MANSTSQKLKAPDAMSSNTDISPSRNSQMPSRKPLPNAPVGKHSSKAAVTRSASDPIAPANRTDGKSRLRSGSAVTTRFPVAIVNSSKPHNSNGLMPTDLNQFEIGEASDTDVDEPTAKSSKNTDNRAHVTQNVEKPFTPQLSSNKRQQEVLKKAVTPMTFPIITRKVTSSTEEEDRVPPGMTLVSYDADTEVYTYKDSDGSKWKSTPGAKYGKLTQVTEQPFTPWLCSNGPRQGRPGGVRSNPSEESTENARGKGKQRAGSRPVPIQEVKPSPTPAVKYGAAWAQPATPLTPNHLATLDKPLPSIRREPVTFHQPEIRESFQPATPLTAHRAGKHDPGHRQLRLSRPDHEFRSIDLESQSGRANGQKFTVWKVAIAILLLLHLLTLVLVAVTLRAIMN